MQNFRFLEAHDGHLVTFETAEPVTWKPGEPLLWYHVYNIEVLEREFALILQADQQTPVPKDIWERLQAVDCFALGICDCCATGTLDHKRAANLVRECDCLESYWCHLSEIWAGLVPSGTPFDEAKWAADYQVRARDLPKARADYRRRQMN